MSQKKSAAHIVNSDDALQQSKQEFGALVSGVEDYAIFLLSPEGNVISWNAGAQRIKGYKPESGTGQGTERSICHALSKAIGSPTRLVASREAQTVALSG